MKGLLGAAVFSVLAIAGAPALAGAAPPIQVAACQTSANFLNYGSALSFSGAWTWTMVGSGDHASGPYYTPMDSRYFDNYDRSALAGNPTLAVDYSNQTANVIKSVEFGLMSRGHLIAEFQDAGIFSPAVEIRHDFRIPSLRLGGGLTCVPLKVTFSDGSTWTSAKP